MARQQRPGRTPANPGRSNVDVGGIVGASTGAGAGTKLVDGSVPVPPSSYDEAVAQQTSGLRPAMTSLTAQRPGFWENVLTKGQSLRDYYTTDAQLRMQAAQNAFQSQLADRNNAAALDRLRTEYGLRGEMGDKERAAAEAQRLKQISEADQAAQLGAMDVNRARMAQGLSPFITPLSRASADFAYGAGNIGTRGFGQSVDQMLNTGTSSELGRLEDMARIGYARENPGVIAQAYDAGLRAPVIANDVAERRMTETEKAGEATRKMEQGTLDLRKAAQAFTEKMPINLGSHFGMIAPDGSMQTFLSQQEQKPEVFATKDANGRIITDVSKYRPPSIIQGKKILPANDHIDVGATPMAPPMSNLGTTGGNPAPQPAAPPASPIATAPTLQAPMSRISTPEYPDMTPMMQQIAQGNMSIGEKQRMLMPLAQQQQGQYEDLLRRQAIQQRAGQLRGLKPSELLDYVGNSLLR